MLDIQSRERSLSGFVPVGNSNDKCTHLRVSVFHQKGQGFVLNVIPVVLENRPGIGNTWTTVLTKGKMVRIEEANRYNEAKLAKLFNEAAGSLEAKQGLACTICQQVASHEGVNF